jgi:carbamoyl-phosphate synthase small subunit
MGIANVDTRAITRRLRVTGCLNGVISTDPSKSDADLLAATKAWTIVGKDLISEVTCAEPYVWKDVTGDEWEFAAAVLARAGGKPYEVVAYDFGIKLNILRRLASFGCRVTVVPADYPADKVLAMNPDGVFFSNGPVREEGGPERGRLYGRGVCERPVGSCASWQQAGPRLSIESP